MGQRLPSISALPLPLPSEHDLGYCIDDLSQGHDQQKQRETRQGGRERQLEDRPSTEGRQPHVCDKPKATTQIRQGLNVGTAQQLLVTRIPGRKPAIPLICR